MCIFQKYIYFNRIFLAPNIYSPSEGIYASYAQ